MCLITTHPHAYTYFYLHSLTRAPTTAGYTFTSHPTKRYPRKGKDGRDIPFPWGLVFFLLFPPKTSGSPPPREKSTWKMGARNQPPRRPAPNTPREINYRTESAQNLQHECRCGTYPSLASRATAPAGDGSLGLGTGVGGMTPAREGGWMEQALRWGLIKWHLRRLRSC